MTTKAPITGVYCLIINLKEKSCIQIGKKGKILFEEGCYVYVGSALNSLPARIMRHLRQEKKLHWHIDYLLKNADSEIVDVIFTLTTQRLECQVADELSKQGIGVKKFGCSDCNCHSHLFYFNECSEADEACQNTFSVLKQDQKTLKDLKNWSI
jgi:Uri superfamily endonuclease